jgi:DNA-binding LacI/PurR family transcriptional regulator
MSKQVTLQDIADDVGVSRSCVSLALRNHPRIPQDTRERIIAAAEKLGYQPNADIARLMALLRDTRKKHDRPVIALVTDYPEPLALSQPPNPTWLGFCARAETLGYLPEEFHISGGLSPSRLTTILRTRAIRGVVFAGLLDPSFVERMDLGGFAIAAIGNAIHSPALHRSTSDKHANTFLTCQRLWAKGCRRIALVIPRAQEERVEHTFLSGYLLFHYLHKHPAWRSPLVNEDNWNPVDRIARWIKEQHPDAVIAAHQGFLPALARCNIPAPPFVCLVHVESPGQSGINQRHDLIAAGAVDLVDAQLKRNETGLPSRPKHLHIPGDWVE